MSNRFKNESASVGGDPGDAVALERNETDSGEIDFDRRWHLAQTPHEVNVTELEYALMRAGAAFYRWQAECLGAVSGITVTGEETALLHVIRLNDRPKGLKEIARLTNRDDLPNLQYALRKFSRLGLVTRTGGKSGAVYSVTPFGHEATERYAKLRANLLIEFTEAISGLDDRMHDATQTINLLSGIYEQAARVAATHRRRS